MLTNSVLLAVIVMLVLSVSRVHVVLALFIGAVVGGLLGGLGLDGTMVAFQDGLGAGAKIALSYALLGAFAMAVANSGLPELLARWLIAKVSPAGASGGGAASARTILVTKYLMVAGILAMSIMSQNLIPVHIAFIPLLIPPLLSVMNALHLDRRLVACVLTFGLVTTYMYLPIGFGAIFLNDILLGNIAKGGMDTSGISIMTAMGIPALGMVVGLLVAVFVSYRKPRTYAEVTVGAAGSGASSGPSASTGSVGAGAGPDGAAAGAGAISTYRIVMSLIAIVACFGIQLWMNAAGGEADALLVGALVGLAIFLISGAVPWKNADDVFTQGMRMMALIGFIMISAQGFAAVMTATGDIEPLVNASSQIFAGSKGAAALGMLLVGLIVTMGIGSSFSTLPIIAAIYVPLCVSLGFSPLATVALIGTAGALGDAGSPASDSTLGPTSGLNADGQHDHIRDSVIPTFLHFNIPLLIAGWIAAMVL
ncbi:MAG: Na+/H+ antiporter NhaC family protein [Dermabacter sp.]|nr:Na+/H+ antiporter NhaC family protein [Dermabacter sp.]